MLTHGTSAGTYAVRTGDEFPVPVQFSVIVPTRNRAAMIDRCLSALEVMDYPKSDFEVLVVDDGSTPPPTAIFQKYARTLQLRTFRTEGVGPARARNLALAHATGHLAVFTDDDCRPGVGWLRAYSMAAQQHADAGLGGPIFSAPENNIFGHTSQMLVTYLYKCWQQHPDLRFFCANNFAFPREHLLAMGGFDEGFPLAAGEDRYLCMQWLRQRPLLFVPDAGLLHRQALGMLGFLRQQFRYGRGAFQFWLRRFREDGTVNEVQPPAFYLQMLHYPFGRTSPLRAVTMSGLLLLSQCMGVLGYFAERRKSNASGWSTGAKRS